MVSEYQAIIFDFGNVIININPELTYQEFAKASNKSVDKIKFLFEENQVFKKFETGLYSEEEFLDSIRQILGFPLNDIEIIDAWNALLLDVPLERIELLNNLRNRYPIYLLSNTNSIHIKKCNAYFRQKFNLNVADLFDRSFLSYEMGLFKPDQEIYKTVLKEINLNAEKVLFIDDNFDNIESAKLLGLQTIHIDLPNTLTDYLKI